MTVVDLALVYKHIPKVFGTLAFIVNPIFVYLIFTEKSTKFGNYRYVLLYFAMFNLVYSIANVVIPIDIHSYRYCFYLFISDGLFVESTDWHLFLLSLRCALVASSYAVLLSHFIYRYLVVLDSTLTKGNFHIFMMMSFGIFLAYTSVWHASCYFLGSANPEIKEYIREDFGKFYGINSTDRNMISCLYNEGTDFTVIRSWSTTTLWTSISAISICVFLKLAHMIMRKLENMTGRISRKTSRLQIELLRALIVQTIIPIFVSFFPCVISFTIPIFNMDLGRPINYVEVIALGAFVFCDPVAIVMCLPVFRQRVLCKKKQLPDRQINNATSTTATIKLEPLN
ncbi:hypothetical protein GCK72_011476 [Caenorhabditis remanei]|uniref:Uncharacterized protein n=1 Tax=Caenorhabditis remanei TaxID=31234 RepID=A0A6A5H5W5_CAERE|nr:hypothetical protein GCK72_011476 [Caenorhabditis remanei]KAF1763210.1 hypothetical protein GCK72_011476 [Caenorhabditis remanei]